MKNNQSKHVANPKPFWGSRYSIGLVIFGSIALYFLLTEHRAHFFGVLPILLLLSCLFMHLFMHHGHRHGGDNNSTSPGESQTTDKGEQP